jgi:hypothetical protein
MFVRWNEKGTMIIDLTRTMRDENGHVVIDPEREKIKTRRDTVLLGPGINEIAAEEFELAFASIQLVLAGGQLKVVEVPISGREVEQGATNVAQTITDLSIEDALEMIAQCGIKDLKHALPNYGNRDTLYRWLAEDARPEIRSAIRARLVDLHFFAPDEDPLEQDLNAASQLVGTGVAAWGSDRPLTREDYTEHKEPEFPAKRGGKK